MAIKQYIPDDKIYLAHKDIQLADLTRLLDDLTARVRRFPEETLDNTLLPHLLLGKITLLEMMNFTAYHVVHHQERVMKNLEKKPG